MVGEKSYCGCPDGLDCPCGCCAKAVYPLCLDCEACPTVEVLEDQVRIGEEGNRVTLKRGEWNRLVAAIKRGELKEL